MYCLIDLAFAGRQTVLYVQREDDAATVEIGVTGGMVARADAEGAWAQEVKLHMRPTDDGNAFRCGAGNSVYGASN